MALDPRLSTLDFFPSAVRCWLLMVRETEVGEWVFYCGADFRRCEKRRILVGKMIASSYDSRPNSTVNVESDLDEICGRHCRRISC